MSPSEANRKQLYRVADAMVVLSMSRSVIYEQIRSGRLRSVTQGRTRLIPASAIAEYIALLEREARRRLMTARRSRGDGGLSWDNTRQRWIAAVTVGYTTSGKRIVKRGSGRTKTEAQRKLKEILRDYEDGLVIGAYGYTVADAVRDWLAFGLSGRDGNTVTKCTILANTHIIPALGARKLRDLSADDVDRWLADKAQVLSTRTLREVRSVLKRAITRAQARDKVKRNVVLLCDIPQGRTGRPSKSLTLAQAEALLAAAEGTSLHAYIVVSLLTGARTEELRPLTWSHVDLDSDPPFIMVWRSVRAGGDTKTKKSRRTLALPQRCVDVLREPSGAPRPAQAGSRYQLARQRPGVPIAGRHASRCLARATLLPQGRRSGRAGPRGVDAARAAAQLRLAAVRCRRPDRADLPAGRPQRDHDHRDGLPQADPPGDHATALTSWTGSSLARGSGCLVTHLVTQHRRYAGLADVVCLLSWSGWPDLNRRPLRPERSALPSCATPRPRGTSPVPRETSTV